ncbi:unnamed protein product [Closterium sp. NIES-53]
MNPISPLFLSVPLFSPISPSRPLQAMLVVADAKVSLTITGNGDVLEPHDGIIGESVCVWHGMADAKVSLTITGNGDVLEPHDGIIEAKVPLSPPLACEYATLVTCLEPQDGAQAEELHVCDMFEEPLFFPQLRVARSQETRSSASAPVIEDLFGDVSKVVREAPGVGIGSGGPYALAAARALADIPDLTAEAIGAWRGGVWWDGMVWNGVVMARPTGKGVSPYALADISDLMAEAIGAWCGDGMGMGLAWHM